MPREGWPADVSVGSSASISQGCSQLLGAGRVRKGCRLGPPWAQSLTLPSQTPASTTMGGFVRSEVPSVRPQGPLLCSSDSTEGHLIGGRGDRVPREMPSNRSFPEDSGLSKYSIGGLILAAACQFSGNGPAGPS